MLEKIKDKLKTDTRLPYLLIIPIYYFFFYLEEFLITENYTAMHIPLDDIIPFLEGFIVPYQLWMPAMILLGVYFYNRDHVAFKKYMTLIGLSFMSALAIYAIFPNGQDLRPEAFPRENFFTWIIGITYSADTNTNVFPSLHVVGSIVMIFAVFECNKLKNAWFRILTIIFCFFTAVSTVFVKQHSAADLIAAIPYSVIMYIIVYKFNFPFCLFKKAKKG